MRPPVSSVGLPEPPVKNLKAKNRITPKSSNPPKIKGKNLKIEERVLLGWATTGALPAGIGGWLGLVGPVGGNAFGGRCALGALGTGAATTAAGVTGGGTFGILGGWAGGLPAGMA